MSESVLFRIPRGITRVVEDALQALEKEDVNGYRARELEDALRVCAHWPEEFQEIEESAWRKLIDYQVENSQVTGEAIRDLFDGALATLDRLQELLRQYERAALFVKGAAQLPGIRDELQNLRHRFVEHWPWIDAELIREALAEYARGESQTVREILDELQNMNR